MTFRSLPAIVALVGLVAVAAPAKSRHGVDWTTAVSADPSGGMVVGNPKAKVRLVEYGSLTCSHCRTFEQEGFVPLFDTYVKTGKVAFEFRNYVRDPLDLTAALIARCGGPKTFFPVTRALFADQATWVGKMRDVPKEKIEALNTVPDNQQFFEVAKLIGLQDYSRAQGITPAASEKCLTNDTAIQQLISGTEQVATLYPGFLGTPTFILNGQMLDKTATWQQLEPQLRAATGG